MAKKKIGAGTIAAIAVAVIIGLGSVSALLRGREEKEDEAATTCVPHTYAEKEVESFGETVKTYSNICERCGERMEVINCAEVKVGYNLSGYKIRYVESKKSQLSSHLYLTDEELVAVDIPGQSCSIGFYSVPCYPDAASFYLSCNDNGIGIAGEPLVYFGGMASVTDPLPSIPEHEPFGAEYIVGNVGAGGNVGGDGVVSEILNYFEFYYVGETAAASATAYSQETPADGVGESVDLSTITEDGAALGWTKRY